jgi:hypothetical protein
MDSTIAQLFLYVYIYRHTLHNLLYSMAAGDLFPMIEAEITESASLCLCLFLHMTDSDSCCQ